jgi:hypothetical protein
LLHDAAEAYVGDVVAPVREALRRAGTDAYEALERRVLAAIAIRFVLPTTIPDLVWEADRRMLATERDELFKPGGEWPVLDRPYKLRLDRWYPEVAESEFLDRWNEIKDMP